MNRITTSFSGVLKSDDSGPDDDPQYGGGSPTSTTASFIDLAGNVLDLPKEDPLQEDGKKKQPNHKAWFLNLISLSRPLLQTWWLKVDALLHWQGRVAKAVMSDAGTSPAERSYNELTIAFWTPGRRGDVEHSSMGCDIFPVTCDALIWKESPSHIGKRVL